MPALILSGAAMALSVAAALTASRTRARCGVTLLQLAVILASVLAIVGRDLAAAVVLVIVAGFLLLLAVVVRRRERCDCAACTGGA
ncbi:MAG TPA: hypothetical protein VGG83_10600 [Trebonia sp.]|jgi:hypothetical protein